jgi:ABC-type multidrug transport system permease subunit
MLRLYFPLMFVSSLFFSPAIILGVRCVQTGKVEIADMWPGGRRYLLVTLYVALCTAVIQTCYWMWYVPALFVYPLFLLGLTYISTGDGFGVSIRKSIHYATRSYGLAVGWTFLYLMLRIICNYTIVGPIFSAPFTVLLLGLAARDFGDLKVYVGNPLSHDDFSNPLSIQGAWPPPPVSLSQEKPEESKDNDPPWNKEM